MIFVVHRQRVAVEPEFSSFAHRINAHLKPPHWFIAAAMNFAMVTAAQGHRELIAHFATESWALRKAHMVSV
jgi:hypothetical protein